MLTRLALRFRLLTIGLMLAVVGGGAYSLTQLQIELFPDIDFPAVTVFVSYPQAPPQQVLQDVTAPIEQALAGLEQVDLLQTISSFGMAQIVVLADFGADTQALEAEINRRLEPLRFPPGVTPVVARMGLDEFPIVDVAVTGDGDLATLAATVRDQVLPALMSIPGVFSADVPIGIEDGSAIARANGRPAVTISVLKDSDANTVEVANAVLAVLEETVPTLLGAGEFIVIENQGPQIQASIDELTQKVLLGGVLAVAVMFAFLLSVRPTLVAAVAIPVSILAALIVMNLQGMTLNILTLGGLAIAVGRVVDDSIVVMENTFRHIQKGESPAAAAFSAAREVAMPITISTLTTIAVFAPLAFIGGFISLIFLPFALTITYSLLASLLVALTVVPVLAALFISKAPQHRENRLERFYGRLVRSALAHRGRTLAVAIGLMLLSFVTLPFIPVSFLPGGGEVVLRVQMDLPGTPGRETILSELYEVEAVLEDLRRDGVVEAYSASLGGSNPFASMAGPAGSGVNLQVRLPSGADAEGVAEGLRTSLAGDRRDVRVSVAAAGLPDSSGLELVLQGDDYATLARAADDLTQLLGGLPGLVNVSHNAIALAGDASGLESMLPIVRMGGRQSVTINGTITVQNTQAVNLEIQNLVQDNPLPDGVDMVVGGVFADIEETFAQMGIAMLLSVLLVYGIMALAQRSFVLPFIIIMSLPLAFIGAFGGLFITGRALGMPAMMGLLMLVGLVVTNAIVLIAFVEQLRAKGLGLYEALVEGGRTRLRPILMTALVTIFVLLPMALEIGAQSGGIIGAELATVVIGGLLASTLLTLVVIPVIYNFLRKKGPAQAEPSPEQDDEAEPAPNAFQPVASGGH